MDDDGAVWGDGAIGDAWIDGCGDGDDDEGWACFASSSSRCVLAVAATSS